MKQNKDGLGFRCMKSMNMALHTLIQSECSSAKVTYKKCFVLPKLAFRQNNIMLGFPLSIVLCPRSTVNCALFNPLSIWCSRSQVFWSWAGFRNISCVPSGFFWNFSCPWFRQVGFFKAINELNLLLHTWHLKQIKYQMCFWL